MPGGFASGIASEITPTSPTASNALATGSVKSESTALTE